MTRATWVTVVRCASGFEADLAVTQLQAAGIPALARGNDIVGLFGPNFQGPTARGVDVVVPSPELARARWVLTGEWDEEDDPLDAA